MADTADLTMTTIKASVLEEMAPGETVDPLKLIERLHESTGISMYDLKAAIWYLIGDQRVRLDDRLDVVRVDQAPST